MGHKWKIKIVLNGVQHFFFSVFFWFFFQFLFHFFFFSAFFSHTFTQISNTQNNEIITISFIFSPNPENRMKLVNFEWKMKWSRQKFAHDKIHFAPYIELREDAAGGMTWMYSRFYLTLFIPHRDIQLICDPP